MSDRDDIFATVEQHNVRWIDLWFTDILGVIKGVTVPVEKLADVIEHGTHFDGSSIDGFARVAESDMELVPDLATFRLLPWGDPDERQARIICNAHTPQGEAFIGDPRIMLIRALEEAEMLGYTFKTGMEMEFFLFRLDERGRPLVGQDYDRSGYFELPPEHSGKLRRAMMTALDQLGIRVHSTHSEIGPGQHEFEFAYDHALNSADAMLTAKVALRTVAQAQEIFCTFMPRPIAGRPGSGLHTHQSLHDAQTGANLFSDPDHEYGLSQIARHFLAGQLYHARAMTAVLAPLVNSYKRLGKSFEAPVYVSWAHVNRSALIRVPGIADGRTEHARLELRCPDPSSNPYLAAAVMLRAGLDGIRHQMTLPDPLEETLLGQSRSRLRKVEMLPTTLGEALDALRADDVMREALGPYISDRFIEAKQQEFDAYNQHVTQWEIDRYLGRY